LRLFPQSEVAALADLVEKGEVGVGVLEPAAWGPLDLAGKVVKLTGTETSGGAWAARNQLPPVPLPR